MGGVGKQFRTLAQGLTAQQTLALKPPALVSAAAKGGKRAGAGRPALPEWERCVKVAVSLKPEDDELLKELGAGNRSVGLRYVIEQFKKL